MLTLGLSAALAATPVFTLGDVDAAVARVAAATGTHPADLDGRDLAEVLAGQPLQVVGGSLTSCTGPGTDLATLQTLQVQLQGAVNYVRLDEAAALVTQADSVLACLAEPVDPDLASRVQFLAGVVHHQRARPQDADRAFRRALAFDPDLVWDPRLSPRLGQPRFDAVRTAAPAPVRLRLSPPPTALTLRVDGVPVAAGTDALSLAPGPHHLQWEDAAVHTLALVLDQPAAELVLPVLQVDPAWLTDDAGRTWVADRLAEHLGPDTALYLVAEDLWLGQTGSAAWQRVLPPDRAPVKALRWGGTALAGAGALAAAVVWQRGWALRQRCGTEVGPERYASCAEYEETYLWLGARAWPTSLIVGGVGAAAAVAGVGLRRLSLTATPLPGGGAVQLHWQQGGTR